MYSGSPFTVAGMSQSTTGHHHSPNAWGSTSTSGPLSTPFGDSLSQSRSQYQSGYLVSSQINNSPQGNQRVDEVPIVQTKAQINQLASRGSTSEFGMDSMFKSSRQRQKLADEDAPPTSSVNDIPTENFSNSTRFQPKASTLENSTFSRRQQRSPASSTPQQTNQQPIYVIVFGYPVDRYTSAVEYFKSLGSATEPDANADIVNCFRIGYHDPADALRAVRKNGEILGGSWMVGAKFADPLQAEMTFGQNAASINTFTPSPHAQASAQAQEPDADGMVVDQPTPSTPSHGPAANSVGTPIRLAPSTSAFRKNINPVAQPEPAKAWGVSAPAMQHSQSAPALGTTAPASKGMLGQVSDLIFGW